MEQIVKNNVNKDYDKIYFFILGKKRDRYSVDFSKYNTQKWEWKIELKCIYIRCNALVEKNLQEASELITNDCISYQLRVDWSGDVYISTITGAEEIDDVKFRWESWDPGNEYVEPCAASDHEYVKNSVASLKKCWEDGVRVYCDYYAIL